MLSFFQPSKTKISAMVLIALVAFLSSYLSNYLVIMFSQEFGKARIGEALSAAAPEFFEKCLPLLLRFRDQLKDLPGDVSNLKAPLLGLRVTIWLLVSYVGSCFLVSIVPRFTSSSGRGATGVADPTSNS